MTAADFRAALASLQYTQRSFAAFVACNERTVRRWAEGAQDIPGWVPVMLRLMEQNEALIHDNARLMEGWTAEVSGT